MAPPEVWPIKLLLASEVPADRVETRFGYSPVSALVMLLLVMLGRDGCPVGVWRWAVGQ